MTTTLIVLAHPERRSFNGVWADATHRISENLGHEVLVSDLVRMRFDPVECADHHLRSNPGNKFDPLRAQEEAAGRGELPDDVAAEIGKLHRSDRVVFHFPLWWFAPPAILKGWLDRVLAHGATHTVDQRFDRGLFRGKKALLCVTTGSSEAESSFCGKEGDIQLLLWPIAYTLRYVGITVLEHVIIHDVHGYHGAGREAELRRKLERALENHRETIAELDERPALPFNADDDFGRDGKLRRDRPSYSPFIRHAL